MKYILSVFLCFFCLNAYALETCPSNNFLGFLSHYLNDIKAQGKWTAYPLRVTIFNPTLEDSIEEKELKTINYPVIPDSTEIQKKELEITISSNPNEVTIVTLRGSNNGLLIKYHFLKTNNCWKLVAILDHSA